MKTILYIMLLLGIVSLPATSAEGSRPDSSREGNVSAEIPEPTKSFPSSGNEISTLSSESDYTLNSLQIPRQIPPSPTAASLGVYGAIPVGHYTGIPQIEIPLYEIKCGSLTIPISLSYHASGIKVAAEAGWAGMGWTLNAGGAITRSVAGVDDFNDEKYKGLVGFSAAMNLPDHHEDPQYILYNDEMLYGQIPWYGEFYSGRWDTNPDLFNYNFGGYSGQMVFPKRPYDMKSGVFMPPMILNRDPIDVTYQRKGTYVNDAGKWKISTPDGSHYYFSTTEITRDTTLYITPLPAAYPVENKQPKVCTAWYLDKVDGAYNETVEFIYEKNAQIQTQKQGYYNEGRNNEFYTGEITQFVTHTYGISTNDEILLREIRFKGGKVIFKTQNRTDLLYKGNMIPQALSEMFVISDQGDTIKRVEFEMDYYNGNGPSPIYQRLRLKSIIENKEKKWNFTYSKNDLPSKNSVMVDYWGYFNNKYHNIQYCPIEDIPFSSCMEPYFDETKFHIGADRDATEAAIDGILTRIEYPTGGYTDFEYELHDFNNSDASDIYSEFKYKYEYIEDSKQENDELIVCFTVTTPAPIYCKTIARYSEGLPCQGTSIGNSPYIDFTKTDFTPTDVIWRWEKKQVNGLWTLVNQRYWGDITCKDVISRTEAAWKISGTTDIIQPGEYRVIMPTYNNTRANIEVIIPHIKEIADYRGGGARIKCICSVDGFDTLQKIYTYTDASGLTSGLAHIYPRTLFTPDIIQYPIGCFHHASSNIYPNSGISVGYDRVTETTMHNEEPVNETIYTFYNDYVKMEKLPRTSGLPQRIFHENGKPKSVVIKDKDGKLLRETYYTYERDENSRDSLEGLHILPYPGKAHESSLFNFYRYHAEWWYLDNERTTVWENGKPMTSNIKYEYNNDYRKLVSKTTTYADRQVVKEESKHTCDVSAYSHMADMNRIFPVENNRYRNGKFVFGTRNDYDESLVLSRISQKTGEQPNYEQRIRIEWYNGLCNPIYFLKDRTEKVVCLWSYSGEYPIAEIKNATMDDVLKALGREQGDLAYFTTLAQQTAPNMAPINSLRAKLPDAQVWTYTYKPLVGMLTATDPGGKTTYYDYDAFGRLTGMRDNDGNAIQSFDYHYKQ